MKNNKHDHSLEMHRLSGKLESHDNLRAKFYQIFSRNSKINIISPQSLLFLTIFLTLEPLLNLVNIVFYESLQSDSSLSDTLKVSLTIRVIGLSIYCTYICKLLKGVNSFLKLLSNDNEIENVVREKVIALDLHFFTLIYNIVITSITSSGLIGLYFNTFNQQSTNIDFLVIVFILIALGARFRYDRKIIRVICVFVVFWHNVLQLMIFGEFNILFLYYSIGLFANMELIWWRFKFQKWELDQMFADYDAESLKLRNESESQFQELLIDYEKSTNHLTTSRGEDLLRKLRLLKYQALIQRNNCLAQQIQPFQTAPVLKLKLSTPERIYTLKDLNDNLETNSIEEIDNKSVCLDKNKVKSAPSHKHGFFEKDKQNSEQHMMEKNEHQQFEPLEEDLVLMSLKPDEIDDLIKIVIGRKDIMWLPSFLRSNKNIGSRIDVLKGDDNDDDEKLSPEARTFIINHFTEEEFNFSAEKSEICQISPGWHINEGKELAVIMGANDNFNFDFLELCENGVQNLFMFIQYSTFLFLKFSIHRVLNITSHNLMVEFFRRIEGSYLMNPYHNSTHAVDVANNAAFFLINGLSQYATEFEQACLLISCLAHDIGHPGKNNGFMVASKSKQALIYNDSSVLESYHASILFHILKDEKTNILTNLHEVDQKGFRKYCLQLILDTDLQKHFPLLSKFKNFVSSGDHSVGDEQSKLLLLSMAIKCADISHGAKTLKLHKSWSRRINEEFFAQGDLEEQLGMPVTPMCSRNQSVTKSQEGFLKAIVLPLFESYQAFIQNERIQLICLDQIDYNLKYWQQQQKEETNGKCSFYKDTDYIVGIIQKINWRDVNSNFFEGLWQ